jgi:hypothetical protein
MKLSQATIILAGAAIAVGAFSYSVMLNHRTPVEFFKVTTNQLSRLLLVYRRNFG